MFTFQRPMTMPGCSSFSSTSLSSPIVCAICAGVSTFIVAMRDLQPGLEKQAKRTVGFSWEKRGSQSVDMDARQPYFFRPGQLRAILLIPWSWRVEICCCCSGKQPPPLQHRVTDVSEKRAELSSCVALAPDLSVTVSSQVTCKFLQSDTAIEGFWRHTQLSGR